MQLTICITNLKNFSLFALTVSQNCHSVIPETDQVEVKYVQMYPSEEFARRNEYVINKDLFVYLKFLSSSQYKIFDAINLTFSICFRYSSVIATAILSAEEDGESAALGRLWWVGGGGNRR
jgi:predicted PP-loop superfamily ATPase